MISQTTLQTKPAPHPIPGAAMALQHIFPTEARFGIRCDGCDRLISGTRYVAELGGDFGGQCAHLCPGCWGKAAAQPVRAQAVLGAVLCPHVAPACQCEPNGQPQYGEAVTLDVCAACEAKGGR